MTTYIQRLNDYNRFNQGMQKEAGIWNDYVVPAYNRATGTTYSATAAGKEAPDEHKIFNYLFNLLDDESQQIVRGRMATHNGRGNLSLLVVEGIQGNNPKFKAEVIRAAYQELHGQKSLMGQMPVINGMMPGIIKSVKRNSAKDWIPYAPDERLAKNFEEAVYDDPTQGGTDFSALMNGKPLPDPTKPDNKTFDYLAPSLMIGAPIALIGGMSNGWGTGLGIMGLAGAAGLGYGMYQESKAKKLRGTATTPKSETKTTTKPGTTPTAPAPAPAPKPATGTAATTTAFNEPQTQFEAPNQYVYPTQPTAPVNPYEQQYA